MYVYVHVHVACDYYMNVLNLYTCTLYMYVLFNCYVCKCTYIYSLFTCMYMYVNKNTTMHIRMKDDMCIHMYINNM